LFGSGDGDQSDGAVQESVIDAQLGHVNAGLVDHKSGQDFGGAGQRSAAARRFVAQLPEVGDGLAVGVTAFAAVQIDGGADDETLIRTRNRQGGCIGVWIGIWIGIDGVFVAQAGSANGIAQSGRACVSPAATGRQQAEGKTQDDHVFGWHGRPDLTARGVKNVDNRVV
jgi:hypothetical protein